MSEYEILDQIRLRTAMYTGYSSPTHLHSFLSGYSYAKIDEGVLNEESDFLGFNGWVANKFDYVESTSGWAYMIEDQREDKQEALYLFFELLDEFRGIQHSQIAKINFDHEDKIDRSWTGYSRSKKVRGTFETVWKPSPDEITIQQIDIGNKWYQMVARNVKKEILFTWDSEELEKVFKRAHEIFGIDKDEWKFLDENL